MPPVNAIWQRYLRKFSKNGKLLEDEDPELGCTQDVTQTVLVVAPAAAPAAASPGRARA